MKIRLLNGTTELPLQTIGERAGICWNAPTNSEEANKKRAIGCIKSGHGRVMEYVEIEVVLEGASARMMREIYTHIAGTTRLQSSTRYVSEEGGFGYFEPPLIAKDSVTSEIFGRTMDEIQSGYNQLISTGITKEDAANVLPLGMNSKMVWKINLRSLVNFMNQRLCNRAYHEIRDFAKLLRAALKGMNEEWEWIANNLFVPKCEVYRYINPEFVFCPEAQCCGRHKKITELHVTPKE